MPDEQNENEFPGYPHYPAKEDIMNSKDNERVDLNVENFSRSKEAASNLPDRSVKTKEAESDTPPLADVDADAEDIGIVSGTDSDLTEDDLIALGENETDFGRREQLTGDDLDVPGAEEDDANEEIGEEDEENNYYSLGGDSHEDLEEDKG
jgi:hypothetical protein